MTLYTNVDRVFTVEPRIGSVTNINSETVALFIDDAEALVNAELVRNYTIPVTSLAPMVVAIATDLTIYRILALRIFTQERLKDSIWPDKFKAAEDKLKRLGEGDLLLVDNSGDVIGARTDIAPVTSTTKDFHPTFSELSFTEDIQDPDKLDELANERDLDRVRDRVT